MFKNWTLKEWIALAMTFIVVIGEVILVFVQPWSALYAVVAGVFSFIVGWIASKHVVIQETENKK